LRQAIAERRHELRQRVRFEQQLKEWNGQNRSNDYLLSGVRLAEAHELEGRDDIALRSADAKNFVHCSVEREEARHQKELDDARKLTEETEARRQAEEKRASEAEQATRRLRWRNRIITAVGGLALLAAILAVFFGVNAYQQQRLSRSRELAVVANSQLDVDQERSILIALEANSGVHTFEAEDALRRALVASRIVAELIGHENWVKSAYFSPDGKWIVTAGYDGTARVWEAATGKEVATLRGHEGPIYDAQFSPDGKWIVTASTDETARVWEAATGKEVATLRGHEDFVTRAQFSPDGQWIVTGSDDNTTRVWEAATGKEVATLHGYEGGSTMRSFFPVGRGLSRSMMIRPLECGRRLQARK
jgi:hypothetical protein